MEGTYTLTQLNLTESELQDIKGTRERLVDNHALCGGLGVLYSNGGLQNCACQRSLKAYVQLVRARIPVPYRLLSPESRFAGGLLFGKGKTTALVSVLLREIKAGGKGMYCTATQIDRWCGDEKKEDHAILLDRVRGSGVLAIDDLHLLGSRFPSQAVPALLHELKDSGVTIIGAGEPREGWDVFGGRCEATTHTGRNFGFYELGDEYGII